MREDARMSREAIMRAGQLNAEVQRNQFSGLANALDRGMAGYQRGKQIKREDEKAERDKALSEEQLASSKLNRQKGETELSDLKARMEAQGPTYYSDLINQGKQLHDARLGQIKVGNQLAGAQLGQIGDQTKRLDKAEAETELAMVQDEIVKNEQYINGLRQQGPMSEETAAQIQLAEQNLARLKTTEQALGAKIGSDGALIARRGKAAGRFAQGQRDTERANYITATSNPNWQPVNDKAASITNRLNKLQKLAQASYEYGDSGLTSAKKDEALQKVLAAAPESARDRLASPVTWEGMGEGFNTRSTNIQSEVASERQKLATEIADLEAQVQSSRLGPEMNPTIQRMKIQLQNLDNYLQGKASSPRNLQPLQPKGNGMQQAGGGMNTAPLGGTNVPRTLR